MEIKNCSIYPRYEESLPKISRIPEFALFMYHRHGKSNRVKCLPHSNGQALSARGGKSIRRLDHCRQRVPVFGKDCGQRRGETLKPAAVTRRGRKRGQNLG